MLAACGSAHPTMTSGPATSVAAAALPVSGSSASCAGLTRAQQFKTARMVFVGVMLPGHLVGVADDTQLSSPAQVRVSHYLKGRGPSTVRVLTAVKRSGKGYRFAEQDPAATWTALGDLHQFHPQALLNVYLRRQQDCLGKGQAHRRLTYPPRCSPPS